MRQMRESELSFKNHESELDRWRTSYTLMLNIHRDRKKHPAAFRAQDILPLSFDDELGRDAHVYSPPSPELIEHLKKRFGTTIKKKNGK
jgi:hypothetical protein